MNSNKLIAPLFALIAILVICGIVFGISSNFNEHSYTVTITDKDRVLTSKLPTTSALYNQQAIIKIEQYSNTYYRCTVQGYGWSNSNSYILDLFRKDAGSYDFFANNSSFYKIVNTLPNADEYGVGNMMFYKNRPIRYYADYCPTIRAERVGLKVLHIAYIVDE